MFAVLEWLLFWAFFTKFVIVPLAWLWLGLLAVAVLAIGVVLATGLCVCALDRLRALLPTFPAPAPLCPRLTAWWTQHRDTVKYAFCALGTLALLGAPLLKGH